MKLAILLFVFGSVLYADPMSELPSDNHRSFARSHAKAIGKEISDDRLRALATHTDAALDHIVAIGIMKLRDAGENAYADVREREWNDHLSGFITSRMLQDERDIGDHAPLIGWLAAFYDQLELVLGVETCKRTHLSDIKTFNYTIPVVFHPCTFPMDGVTVSRQHEYRNHFNKGRVYYGLLPVVTYWVVDIACIAATNGAAIVWLCGPVGNAAEWIMSRTAGPILSDKVYEHLCED